jgi:glycine/D-amino acid oxidase-like deaminating enzyme
MAPLAARANRNERPGGTLISITYSDDAGQADLRSRHTPWDVPPPRNVPPVSEDFRCEVLVVGAGITGALVAERLTREGLEVVLIDREHLGRGSTAASTAMLLWEIDRSLSELTQICGFDRAARCYHASLSAAQGLQALVAEHRLPCEMRAKPSLYLAAGETATSLFEEFQLREKAGLPGDFLDHRTLLETFEIARAGAILSPSSADADPVRLTRSLLKLVQTRGARLLSANAVAFDSNGSTVIVGLESGHAVEARHVILATGYVLPNIVRPTIHQVASSFAIATSPQPQNLWKHGALIWEASENYHYARTTQDGRIIFGGEDDHNKIEPSDRDAALPRKAQRLAQRLKALWPRAELDITCRWAGTFDTTQDGLPLIGPVPGCKNTFAAYGYGGNGITFSYLAAELIARLVTGQTSPLLDDFAIDRNES